VTMPNMNRTNDVQVSKNFKLSEFECNNGSHVVILDGELVEKLQALRDKVGKPIRINSAYRTPAYNMKIGGSPKSQHLEGKAADIVISGIPPAKVAELASAVGFRGIGIYNTFTHVDVREKSTRWDFRK
jgi:uncharacterized protein YcbK (DUF882 family)